MTQSPVTVTYSLEEILTRIEGKIDEVKKEITDLKKEVSDLRVGQTRLEERVTGEIKTLEAKIDGIGKRLENQEFISRGVLIALIVAILGGFAKLFGVIGNP